MNPVAPRADVAAIVVGGGGGERLGGVSKPDLTLGGMRLIDRVCGSLLEDSEGRIAVGGDPQPFDQYLMGVYRAGALRRVLDEAVAALGSVRGVGVRRVLRVLALERVSVDADVCRDIDTPEDVAWWQAFLAT